MAQASGRPERVLTAVMFTDLVGSTRMRVALGESRADEVRRAHDVLLTEAVESHGGVVVKGLGDGIMATFDGPSDAIAAAAAIQQAIELRNRRRAGEPSLGVRVGLSAGEVVWEHDDCFGYPVIEASRLCAAADGGQVLASDAVRLLATPRGSATFTPLGTRELKGLPGPVAVHELAWERPEDRHGLVPLPAGLAANRDRPLVGRTAERARLAAAWNAASMGERRVVFVSGELGVGKTRLVTEAAHDTFDAGGVVLYGQADPEFSGPYEPLVEALDRYVATCPIDELRAQLGIGAGSLAGLLPTLSARIPGLDQAQPADPHVEQSRSFQAVMDLLAGIGGVAPVLLILDDLHWAGESAVLLLRHILRSAHALPLLVVATYRHTDLEQATALARLVGDLPRLHGVERLHLHGLDEGDVANLVATTYSAEPTADMHRLASALCAETEGNAFFVTEVLRHLHETGKVLARDGHWALAGSLADFKAPDSVRDVVEQRLARLADPVRDILAVAAVIGREFSVPVLTVACGQPLERVVDALDAAERAHLVVALGERSGFSHALVRSAIYDSLPMARRLWIHRAVGLALQASSASADHMRLGEMAHHLAIAATLGGAEDRARALDACARAGAASIRVFATEEAHQHFERALALMEGVPPELRGGLDAVELLRDAADAARWAGRMARATELTEQAVRAVDPDEDPARAGAVQAQLARYRWHRGDSAGWQQATGEALRLLEDQPDSALRARVLAQHAMSVMLAGRYGAARDYGERALAMARAVGAPLEESHALTILGVSRAMTGDPDAGIAALRTALGMAMQAGSAEEVYLAYSNLSYVLLETGRFAEALEVVEEGFELLRRFDLPTSRAHVAAANAADLLHQLGRWDEAHALASRTLEADLAAVGASLLRFVLADVSAARGEFAQAQAHLQEAADLCPGMTDPQWVGQLHLCRAQLALLTARTDLALDEVDQGLAAVADSEEYDLAIRLACVAMRAQADRAAEARTLDDEAALADAVTAGRGLLDHVHDLRNRLDRNNVLFPPARARVATCEAEFSRLMGRSAARLWESVAAQWAELPCPYPATYARWREAESRLATGDRGGAERALGHAREGARGLGAAPLLAAVETLASRSALGP